MPKYPVPETVKAVEEAKLIVAFDAVREPKVAPPTALSWPVMVEEPVTERSEVVAEIAMISEKREVEDAKMPLCAKIGVEVAEVLTPKLVVGVNGKATLPSA